MTGIEMISLERKEQIEKHGHTVKADALENAHEELIMGAIALIHHNYAEMPSNWENTTINKMLNKSFLERLIVAGALLAAEIDRRILKEEQLKDK